ncbi:MAG: DNA polymerase III subunit gamma/tau [Opitutales bacterium]
MPDSSEDSRTARTLRTLETAIDEDRLPHAILLYGDTMDAVESACLGLTRKLLGMADEARQHADLHEIRPQGAARIIAVKQTRALIKEINHASSQGINKVAIAHEADRMNTAAANAFLKTLEEPPPHTTIFLLTTKPYSFLPTIKSRCQRFRVSSPPQKEDRPEWLEWLAIYRQWLGALRDPKQVRSKSCDLVLGVFGLVYRFEALLSTWTDEAWEKMRQTLPEELEDKEIIAIQSGCRKGIRNKLFVDLEFATQAFAKEQGASGAFPATAVTQAIEIIEQAAGLMEVNLKETTALEHFLLQSLRIWANRG